MEINKQLFEDVLAGKLKGTFILRNGFTVKSNRLICFDSFCQEYAFKGTSYIFDCNGGNPFCSIIDFKPDTIECASDCGSIWFKSKELAQQAIEILGEETVKLVLEPLGI